MFVDTVAYDTSRNPVVKNFFSTLPGRFVASRISHCDAGGDSDAPSDAARSREPENFTRTGQATESSYGVSAGTTPEAQHSFTRFVRVSLDRLSCLKAYERTANLGHRVSGDSLIDVFSESAVGLVSLIVAKVDSVAATTQRMIELNSPNLEYLQVDWLSELLFFFESKGWLTAKASVKAADKSLRRTRVTFPMKIGTVARCEGRYLPRAERSSAETRRKVVLASRSHRRHMDLSTGHCSVS